MPEQPCAFHPNRLTGVTCSHCGRPICPDDMIPAPVGNQCPICAGRMREGPLGEAAYRARTKAESIPALRAVASKPLTQVILAANVLVFLLMLGTGSPTGGRTLIRFGALVRPLPEGEAWRMVTSMFVHIGLLHLMFNMFALYVFGPAIENRYGKIAFLGMYFGAGLLGAAASLAFNDGPGVAAGASGGVFGILGGWIAFFLRHRSIPSARQQLQSLLMLVGINLIIGLSGGIDNFAHLGGLAGGFVIGSLFEAGARMRGNARVLAGMAGWLAVVGVAAALVVPRTCEPGSIVRYDDGRAVPCTLFTGGSL